MSRSINLKKGFNIRLEGCATEILSETTDHVLYGVKPIDFPGLIPKLEVRQGDEVLAGTPLFHDKIHPEIKFTSPVSGKVVRIERGERRKILEVVVERSGNGFVDFGKADPAKLSSERIKEVLLNSGAWPAVRQRPYHVIADPRDNPKSVFIPGFDTAPLAPDFNFIIGNYPSSFLSTGISVLSKLTNGKVNLILDGKGSSGRLLENVPGVEISYFSGPHPAGNVGVHIHHIDPLNKGEIVWFVNLQDLIMIGRLFEEGVYRPERIVALTGTEVIHPQYYRTLSGTAVSSLLAGNLKPGNLRIISGNVLTGTKIDSNGYLGFYDSQLSVIPEGNYYEFFGWASPGVDKFSFSHTFLSSLFPERNFRLDTNLHGGERAFVVTGQYEKVMPMDIFPMQLLKAIMAEDIDMMENLGIYEVAEEDFALCEFICPSKIEIQSVVRKGLDLMRKEMS